MIVGRVFDRRLLFGVWRLVFVAPKVLFVVVVCGLVFIVYYCVLFCVFNLVLRARSLLVACWLWCVCGVCVFIGCCLSLCVYGVLILLFVIVCCSLLRVAR